MVFMLVVEKTPLPLIFNVHAERKRKRENNFHAKCLCAFRYCCHTAPSIVVVAVAIAAGFMLFFFLPKLFTFVIYFEQILSYSNR